MSDANCLLLQSETQNDSTTPQSSEPLAVDARRLAAMLSLGLRTVRSMDAAGKLPRPIRIGSAVRWQVAEIREWMAAGCPSREEWESSKKATSNRR